MSERYHLLDALRGLSIALMVLYHFGYDLVAYGYLPYWALYNPLLNFLQPFFAGIFILLCGASSRFSHSNFKRGMMLAALATAVTVITVIAGSPIMFGILHFLSIAILLYAAVAPMLSGAIGMTALVLYTATFALTYQFYPRATKLQGLWMFGLEPRNFVTTDYFPLLPWFFCFLIGVWFGGHVINGHLPRWFYKFNMPILPTIGRHTLIIYLGHQVVLTGVIFLFQLANVPTPYR